MKQEELIIGEIYNYPYANGHSYILKYSGIHTNNYSINGINIHIQNKNLNNPGINLTYLEDFLKKAKIATSEEKHWLNKCIEVNRFISKEEALKDFKKYNDLPENWYVKITTENKRVLEKWYGDGVILPLDYIVGMIKWSLGNITKGTNPVYNIESKDYPMGIYSYSFGNEISYEKFKYHFNIKDDKEIIPNNGLYSIEQIEKVLLKEYDRDDITDIINTIKKLKT